MEVTMYHHTYTLAGSGIKGFRDGAGGSAQFNCPYGVAVDGEGNVVVADTSNHRIRRIRPPTPLRPPVVRQQAEAK